MREQCEESGDLCKHTELQMLKRNLYEKGQKDRGHGVMEEEELISHLL